MVSLAKPGSWLAFIKDERTVMARATRAGWVTFAIALLATVPFGCKQKSVPVYGGDNFAAAERDYDLPMKIVDPFDVNDGVRRATEFLKATTPHGIKWSDGNLNIEVFDGAVTLNGKKYGLVKPGDKVKLTLKGSLFVNGVERAGIVIR